MKIFVLLLLLCCIALPRYGYAEDEVFAVRTIASKKQSVILSAFFPGLGQLSTGHKVKGTILLAAEVGALAAALTANENYQTRFDEFKRLKTEYEGMAAGNSRYDLAQQKWEELSETNSDLDDLHTIRRAFGAVAAAVYLYSLFDVIRSDSPTTTADARGWGIQAVPGEGGRPTKMMIVGRF